MSGDSKLFAFSMRHGKPGDPNMAAPAEDLGPDEFQQLIANEVSIVRESSTCTASAVLSQAPPGMRAIE